MKLNTFSILLVCCIISNYAHATEPRVLERGAHYKVLETEHSYIDQDGHVVIQKSQYTEVQNGMHFLKDGQWQESRELIEPSGQGFLAQYGVYQVAFKGNLNNQDAIKIKLPSGDFLRCSLSALALYDYAQNKRVFIGLTKDCSGEIQAPSVVVYRDVFSGISADIRYSYRKGAIEGEY